LTGKVSKPKLRQTGQNCLYLDEIIDVKLLKEEGDA
jgi:hypothetical protein